MTACENCGGSKERPRATFCATCACERTKAFAQVRGIRRWQRIKADPLKHLAWNRRKLVYNAARLTRQGGLNHERKLKRDSARRHRRGTLAVPRCLTCGVFGRPKRGRRATRWYCTQHALERKRERGREDYQRRRERILARHREKKYWRKAR